MRRELSLIAPSTNVQLSQALSSLGETIKRATEEALRQNPDWEEYSETEKRAMILIGALKNINGMDLMAIQLRYQYLVEIERTNALTAHPEQYQTLSEMAAAQGISVSELSKIKDLCGIVFPYLEGLGMNIAQLWENVGKAKFFELTGILKALITGEPSTNSVNNAVNYLIGDAIATNLASGIEYVSSDEEVTEGTIGPTGIRNQVIDHLLTTAENVPFRELRNHTRPTRTQNVQALLIKQNGQYYFLAGLDEDQVEMVNRILAHHVDFHVVDLPEDPSERQDVLFSRPEFRRLYSLVE